jgi:translation initiation factor IF-2
MLICGNEQALCNCGSSYSHVLTLTLSLYTQLLKTLYYASQILLQAEVLDLKANPNRLAQGVVIEAAMRQGLGPVATTLIQRGTLRTGDIFVSGASYGKVRLLMDHTGKRVKEALPSMPVQIVGFDTVPGAGDNFMVVDKEETARAVAEARKKILREAQVTVCNCLLCNCLLQLLTLFAH